MKLFFPECKSTAVIFRSVPKGERFNELYCPWPNLGRGHTYVLNYTSSHTFSPDSVLSGANFHRLLQAN